MFITFIIGTAGSGKSLLTASFAQRLNLEKQKVVTLNMDPGVAFLPYVPDVDVRNYVTIEKVVEQYGLGPNGALIMAADLIANETEKIGEELEDLNPDIVLIDTPGQLELFAFRESGPYITQKISDDPKAILYLFDSVFSTNPVNYVSNMFLSAAVYTRFGLPQIHVLSKIDLLPDERMKLIMQWADDFEALELSINQNLMGTKRLLNQRITQTIYQLGLDFPLVPISSKTNQGFLELNAILERIFKGGNQFTKSG
jgi:GTPase SAR1 family protein